MRTLESFSATTLPNTGKPRYQAISELIVQKVNSGSLKPGQMLPSENEFAKLWKVSKNTVVRAIIDLKNKGIIERQQGKGTFVAKTARVNNESMVALLMRTSGHLFTELSKNLIKSIQATNYYPIIIDPFVCEDEHNFQNKINRLLDTHPQKIIAYGDIRFPFYLLKEREFDFEQITFIIRFESSTQFSKANRILSNYFSGGYQVISHFLDSGRRDCALFTYYHPPADNPSMPQNPIHQELVNGCRQAFVDRDLDPDEHFQIIFDIAGNEPLRKILKSANRPRAIFAFGDNRAKHIFDLANECGLKIPQDIAVSGYYDTPWVDFFHTPLTSVSLNLGQICNEAVGLINDSVNQANVNRVINPRLIVRDSSKS